MRSIVAISIALFVGCDALDSREDLTQYGKGTAAAILAYAQVTAGNDVIDDDESDELKPGQTCPNCDGRGTSGDGLTKCRVCGGDGKIDDRDIQATKAPAEPIGPPKEPPPDRFGNFGRVVADFARDRLADHRDDLEKLRDGYSGAARSDNPYETLGEVAIDPALNEQIKKLLNARFRDYRPDEEGTTKQFCAAVAAGLEVALDE